MVSAGMPLDSIEEAEKWRAQNSKEGLGHKSKHNATTAAARKALLAPPVAPLRVPSGDEGPDAAIARLREIERRTYQLLDVATRNAESAPEEKKDERCAILPGLIRTYQQAVSNRLEAEAKWDAHRKRLGLLVPVEIAQSIIAKKLGPLDAQLNNFAKQVAPQANPREPAVAEKAISEGIQFIRKQMSAPAAVAVISAQRETQPDGEVVA